MDSFHLILILIIAALLLERFAFRKIDKEFQKQKDQQIAADRAWLKKLEKTLMNYLLQKRSLAKK